MQERLAGHTLVQLRQIGVVFTFFPAGQQSGEARDQHHEAAGQRRGRLDQDHSGLRPLITRSSTTTTAITSRT